MKQSMLLLVILCISWFAMAEMAEGDSGVKVKDGYALLETMLTTFQPQDGKVYMKMVDERLNQLRNDAKLSREAKLIDDVFYFRYQRLLQIFKLIITPLSKLEVLSTIIEKEFDDFVYATTFTRWSWSSKGNEAEGFAKIANAVEEEFINLQLYLETLPKRAAMRSKVKWQLMPPPPAPAKTEKK